ncbi:hypothetical protein VM1G_02312 [Cytospora mali]|uniref:Uncharacterized protein n=1 Tax=Cytospora mali TaxID=578113 RepID=A0A194VQ81_CYTMA|nr:hypothetical protein VM1G_02312 [Valsa mali]
MFITLKKGTGQDKAGLKQSQSTKDDGSARDEELTGGDLFDLDFGNMEMDMTDLSGVDTAYVDAVAAAIGRESTGHYQVDHMQQGDLGSDFSLPNMGLPSVGLPSTTQEIPAALPTLDSLISPAHSSAHPTSHASSSSRSTSALPSTGSPATSSGGNPPVCSCMQDTMRVVQQLEDDEFHITTLTLDKVLQLQKRLVSQCSSALDCPSCKRSGNVQTVLIIICDRLAEMFECIHRRVQRLGQRIAARSPASFAIPAGQEQMSSPLAPGQLFCNTSGGYASNADCNPGLFLPEMQAMYSEQEQVHLIKALLQLQMDNFQELLDRVSGANQSGASQARRSKIRSLMARLSKARNDIDLALQVVLQLFSTASRTRP